MWSMDKLILAWMLLDDEKGKMLIDKETDLVAAICLLVLILAAVTALAFYSRHLKEQDRKRRLNRRLRSYRR